MGYQPDATDIKILEILMDDAKTPYAEIAQKILVSPGTVHVRMKKLESLGFIQGSSLIINPEKLGYDLCAFLGVYLDKGSKYRDVIAKMKSIPEIVEAHYTTGVYSIFLKVVCKNTKNLRDILNDKIQQIPGIQRTETILSLEESIKRQIQLPEKL